MTVDQSVIDDAMMQPFLETVRDGEDLRAAWPDKDGNDYHGREEGSGEAHAAWAKTLAPEDKKALKKLGSESSNWIRFEKARQLSDGEWSTSPNAKLAQHIEKLVADAPGHEGEVFRGMAVDDATLDKFREGAEVKMDVISSWSRDENVATSFSQSAMEQDALTKKQEADYYKPGLGRVNPYGDKPAKTKQVLFKLKSKNSTVSIERFVPKADIVQRETVNRAGARYKVAKVERDKSVRFTYKRHDYRDHPATVTVVTLEEA